MSTSEYWIESPNRKKCKIFQGNFNNSLWNIKLPEDKIDIFNTPMYYPKISTDDYRLIRKTLYYIFQNPCYRYKILNQTPKYPSLDLYKHNLCIYQGCILTKEYRIQVGIYVDEFFYTPTRNVLKLPSTISCPINWIFNGLEMNNGSSELYFLLHP